MTRNTRQPEPAAEKPEPVRGVQPLYAVHTINPFGKGLHAPAGSIFVPVSEDERNDLVKMEAARELTEDELVVFSARQAASTPAPASTDSDVIE